MVNMVTIRPVCDRLTVRDSIGTVTRSLKFGISSKDDVEDFLLRFTSRRTVSDS